MKFSTIVSMAEVLVVVVVVLAEDLVEDHPFFVFSSSLPASSPCDVQALWSRKPIDEEVRIRLSGKIDLTWLIKKISLFFHVQMLIFSYYW